MEYFVYIVECSNKSLYTGITTNIVRRIQQHNGEIKGGSIYTRSHRPVLLKYTEECATKSDALKREMAIKKLSHEEKRVMCESSV